jgi:hypothetical protein
MLYLDGRACRCGKPGGEVGLGHRRCVMSTVESDIIKTMMVFGDAKRS